MVITNAQAEQRRRALIDAAIAVMSEQGVSQSRLVDIGRRAGISPSQVLYYFNSKAELFIEALRAVEHELRDDFLAAIERLPSAAERLEYLLQAAAPTGPGDYRLLLWMDAWELAPRNAEVARQLQQLEDDWTGLLSDLVHHGIARARVRMRGRPGLCPEVLGAHRRPDDPGRARLTTRRPRPDARDLPRHRATRVVMDDDAFSPSCLTRPGGTLSPASRWAPLVTDRRRMVAHFTPRCHPASAVDPARAAGI